MAKYSITFKCGHDEEIQLTGKVSDREEKIAWMEENRVCADCYRAEQDTKHQATNEQAKESNKEMATLEGSDKQVAWAETIRAEKINEFKSLDFGSNKSIQDAVVKFYEAITLAKFWIENKDSVIRELANSNDEVRAIVKAINNQ